MAFGLWASMSSIKLLEVAMLDVFNSSKLFHSGEKVTLSKERFQCTSCCKVDDIDKKQKVAELEKPAAPVASVASCIPNGSPMGSQSKDEHATLNDALG